MIPMTIQQVAEVTGGVICEGYLEQPITFTEVATDTRKSMKNSLFIALKGDNFNGNQFVDTAQSQGAVACLLDEDVQSTLPIIKVDNTVKAMGQIASWVRKQLPLPTIGITGSSGKTTVKEMLASILECKGQVLATAGNFNNSIGVPLTLFRLTAEDQYAVVEMGASKVADIDEIAQLVEPNIAVITNISVAHLQGLGTIEGIAKVKGELLDHLQENG
ncbi:MAG: UDP-N-acetylmuramoylalanyl-D-glutamyl-2, 6-diaminopimelate--D-alanyl-D-alanine ligase, partial [Gammaproteobacteria bacterium]